MKNAVLAFSRAAAVCALFPFSSLAGGPTGGVVVGGDANATIAGQGTSSTTINQAANLAIINWQQFSIGQGDAVKFIQPSATAVALNRILSGNPTEIYGSLQANGRVIVINPNGIMVGAGGTVDTKGFVASTLNVPDASFLSGGPMLFSGASTAAVRNQGTIQVLGGDVFLIAHTVDNSGTINAPQGTVGLAAGSAIQLVPSGNERISVLAGNSSSPAAVGVNNSGTIVAASAELKAAGGNIYALAINNGGVVRATGLVRENGHIYLRANGGNIQNSGTLAAQNADGSGGTIVLDGGHNATAPATVISSGTIDASGRASGVSGGTVEILGDNVGLFNNALVDVSGDAGGGTALIGGSLHGANSAVQNAEHTYVGLGAVIKADALSEGNGGEIVIWSDGVTRDYGSLSAVGGVAGGNGGFAEVSSKGVLDFDGAANLMAPAGQGGTLLLDPINITISTAAAANITGFNPGTVNTEAFADDNAVSSTFHVNADGTSAGSSFAGVGDGANIVLQAQTDITVANTFNIANETGNNNVSLTLQAGNNVNINAAVTASGTGTLTLSANDNGGGTASGTGAVNFGASGSLVTAGQTVNLSGQNITVGGLGINTTGSANNAGGNVNLNAGGTLALNAPIIAEGGAATAAGAAGGIVTLTGATITTGGTGSINTSGSDATAGLGGAGGNITFTSTGILSAGGLTANGGAGVGSAGGNGGTVHLNAATGITLNNDLMSVGGSGTSVGNGGPISLNTTAGGVNQTLGSLGSGGLLLLGAGTFNIADSGNAVGIIAANVNGSVTYQDANALNIGSVLGQNGIISSGNAINVSTVNGALGVGTGVNAGAGTVTLAAGSSGNDNLLTIAAAVTVHGAGGVTLAADNMTINSTGVINAGTATATLRQFENGTLIHLGGANGVSTLGLSTAELNTVTAGTLQIGDANSGALTVTAAIAPASPLSLRSGATISQNGGATITDGTLVLQSGGTINLPDANHVGVLSLTGAGGTVQFTDAQNLDLQGITAPAQTVTLTASGIDTLGESTGVINVGQLSLNNWGATTLNQANQVGVLTVSGATGALQFTDGQNLDLQGITAPAQTVTLTASGIDTLGESAGVINVGQLSLNNWGTTTLNQANLAGILKVAGATGAFQYTTAANLDVQGIAAAGQTVTLTGSAGHTVSESTGVINANELDLNSLGATTLNQANQVGVLKATGLASTLQFTDAANLDVQGINEPGQTITLTGSGSPTLGESLGIIAAAQLNLNNWGATTLNQANLAGILKVTGAAGTLQFTDAQNLDLQGISAPTHTVTLTAGGVDTLSETVGVINVGQLTLVNWSTTTVGQANQVGVLTVTGATGALQFTDAANLDVQGISDPGQTVTLAGSGVHTVSESTGTINAGELDLNNLGATTLNQGNQVGILKATGLASTLQFADAANLDVQGISDPGQTVTLTAGGVDTLSETSGTINAGQLNLANWSTTALNQPNQAGVLTVTGATGAFQYTTAAANLDVQGIADAGQTVTLAGSGGHTMSESAGIINAGELDLINLGATTLNQANQVGVLKATGLVSTLHFTDAANLDVQGISDPGQTVTLAGSGSPTLGESLGIITAAQLNLNNWGAATLNQPNTVGVLTVSGATGALQFTDAQNLDLQGISASAQTVTLTASGIDTLGESAGVINVGQLNLANWSTTTLNRANQAGVLNVAGATGALQYTGAGNLDVQGISDPGQVVTLTGSGSPTLGESLSVITAAQLNLNNWGAATLNQANQVGVLTVSGATGALQFTDAQNLDLQGISAPAQTVTLTASGIDTLGESAGVINVGQLSLNNWGATTLNQANLAGILKVTGGTGAFQYTTAAANLDVQGIADAGQTVTLTGSGGHTVSESTGIINAGELDLNTLGATTLNQGNQVGVLKAAGVAGSLQFADAGNLDVEGIAASGQAVTIAATGDDNLLTVGSTANVAGSTVTLAGDRINLIGTVTTPGVAWFHESTAGRQITVGTDDNSAPTASGGTLGLTTAEMNNVTAGTLRIGDANSGNLAVTVPLAPAFGTLSLQSGGTISEAPGSMITINNLAVQAASGISLVTANQVGTLAAISGGPIQFNNLGALAIGSADGVNGVTANNSAINVIADSGGLTVNNTPAAADVNAGGGAVNLTAETSGSLLTIAAGAGVNGTGGITFTADDMAISGPINSGTANTIFQPLTAGQVANLGPSFVAGDLNLSQAELNEVTANVLQIGNNTSGAPLGVGLVTAPLTVNQLLIIGGNASFTILSQQLAALSAVAIPAPKLDVAQFSSAALSLDEASKILPAGAIGTIWLQLPFPKEKQRIYKVEEISKWTSGRVAAVGGTAGPQTPR